MGITEDCLPSGNNVSKKDREAADLGDKLALPCWWPDEVTLWSNLIAEPWVCGYAGQPSKRSILCLVHELQCFLNCTAAIHSSDQLFVIAIEVLLPFLLPYWVTEIIMAWEQAGRPATTMVYHTTRSVLSSYTLLWDVLLQEFCAPAN